MGYTVAAFYRFIPLSNLPCLRDELLTAFGGLNLCGSLLLAPEGINGTLAGDAAGIETMLTVLAAKFGLPRDEVKFSAASDKPFDRLKIRLKKEIITFKQPAADPSQQVGTRVAARDWNALLNDPETIVLDTRNRYETMIGTFQEAVVPDIETFTEFAAYVRKALAAHKDKKIAMFCTGGIRCEKASSFMLSEGFRQVYHLQGGILKYLEDVPEQQSRWDGECYVFDRRMAVGHGLTTGRYAMCFTCGYPLTNADRQHAVFEEGVACHHCHATTSDDDKARYRSRQSQMATTAS